nr:hypothetical protein GCM10020093_006030 [Planobispora longispora]
MSPERVEVVWDAIALHLFHEVALRKRPEIALVTAGAGFDLGADGPYTLPAGYADRVHAALPRLHAAAVLFDSIARQALAKPHKAPPYTMPGEFLRQRTGRDWPTWRQLMTQPTGWHDYDGYPRPDERSPSGRRCEGAADHPSGEGPPESRAAPRGGRSGETRVRRGEPPQVACGDPSPPLGEPL